MTTTTLVEPKPKFRPPLYMLDTANVINAIGAPARPSWPKPQRADDLRAVAKKLWPELDVPGRPGGGHQ